MPNFLFLELSTRAVYQDRTAKGRVVRTDCGRLSSRWSVGGGGGGDRHPLSSLSFLSYATEPPPTRPTPSSCLISSAVRSTRLVESHWTTLLQSYGANLPPSYFPGCIRRDLTCLPAYPNDSRVKGGCIHGGLRMARSAEYYCKRCNSSSEIPYPSSPRPPLYERGALT